MRTRFSKAIRWDKVYWETYIKQNDNIKIDLKHVLKVWTVHVALGQDSMAGFASTVMNFRVPYVAGDSFIN